MKQCLRDSAVTHCVEDEDRAELNEAVHGHVSEETKGGNQRTSALSAHTMRKILLLHLPLPYSTTDINRSGWFSKTPSVFILLIT